MHYLSHFLQLYSRFYCLSAIFLELVRHQPMHYFSYVLVSLSAVRLSKYMSIYANGSQLYPREVQGFFDLPFRIFVATAPVDLDFYLHVYLLVYPQVSSYGDFEVYVLPLYFR